MNKLDSENVAAILSESGYGMVEEKREADIILLNTCGVRENAERRIHGRVAELSSLRADRPGLMFGVIGCMAQRLKERLLSHVVSIVAGPDSYRRLPEIISEARQKGVADTVLDIAENYSDIEPVRGDTHSAWVAVMRGCNNFCSYCIVPYTRGRERSLACDTIVEQVDSLVKSGYKEVTLLGQNVNSYNDSGIGFAELLGKVADTGIPWVRFLTSHPADLSDDILETMSVRENICRHLHLPLQSGSDRVLKAMRRRYTVDHYLSIIDKARELMPGIAISTDMIFGFPGESDEDFEESLSVIRRVRYDYGFLYRYSEREGTKAADFDNHVPEQLRIERLKAAIAMQQEITGERHQERIGTVVKMLVKDRSKDGEGWYGMSDLSIPTVVNGDQAVAPGDFLRVRITGTTGASLMGEYFE